MILYESDIKIFSGTMVEVLEKLQERTGLDPAEDIALTMNWDGPFKVSYRVNSMVQLNWATDVEPLNFVITYEDTNDD